ncbi:hypothetical protein ACIP9G_02840 [Lysinibacillus sp. NPDC093197]|uniref:hypothetical protein n=1 Tax=Lysinibacillus sp. NPDC093197 TaxID=3364132 RepID=UPI0037F47F55
MENRRIFSSTWHDGRIYDAKDFFARNINIPFLFVIDTNFAIMIREFVMNKEEFMKTYGKMYDDFIEAIKLIRNNFYRIVYQYSCEEASRDKKTGNLNLEKYKIMTKCFEKVFQIDVDTTPISDIKEFTTPINMTKVPLLKNNGLYKHISIINYVMLVKAFMLKHYNTEKIDKVKIISFLDFMENEVRIFSPITQTFAIHYFGQDSNILKGIKKSKGYEYILNKLYAAAIDLTIPTIAAQLSEKTGYIEIPIFVSFDQGLNTIFDSLLIEKLGETSSGKIVPVYTQKIFYTSGWNNDDIRQLVGYGEKLQKNKLRKERREINDIFLLAEQLEKDLLSFIQ